MITLIDIAKKLSEILNGIDNPIKFEYLVDTEGFHLDKISNPATGKNFIPVFISTMGGQRNPVPNLKQRELTVPITFYYPVRFKDEFFLLDEYLDTVFTGQFINYGTEVNPKNARHNLSIPQYGEIQDLDLKEFKLWVGSRYKREIEVMEPYLSATYTLFISSAGSDFIYGDKVKITKITVNYDGNKILEDTEPLIIERAVVGSSENAPQQSFDETYIKGYPANLGFTKELPLILKNTVGYRALIDKVEKVKDMQKLTIEVTESIPFVNEVTENGQTSIVTNDPLIITHKHYVTNYSRRTAYGQLLGISLTLADLREEEQEEE